MAAGWRCGRLLVFVPTPPLPAASVTADPRPDKKLAQASVVRSGGFLSRIARNRYAQWAAGVAIVIVIVAVRTATQSDAEKKAEQDAIATKAFGFIRNHDKTGRVALGDITVDFYAYCATTVKDAQPNVDAHVIEKYCTCAATGVLLHFKQRAPTDLIAIANLPDVRDQVPVDLRNEVTAACNSSTDAYDNAQ